jgi:hypothetical protein
MAATIYEFKCNACRKQFEAIGTMLEYTDPVFGPCVRRVADCPDCGSQASEYLKPKPARVAVTARPACGDGNCCCMN